MAGTNAASKSRFGVQSNDMVACVGGYGLGQGLVKSVAAPRDIATAPRAEDSEYGANPRARTRLRPAKESLNSREPRMSHNMEANAQQSHDRYTNHADSAAASSPSHRVHSAGLSKKQKPNNLALTTADPPGRFGTVPLPRASAKIPKAHTRHKSKHMSSAGRADCNADTAVRESGPEAGGQCKKEEVRRLARSMASSIENLIDNLHGIVGDLRQLVLQIDTVTECIDASCGSRVPGQHGCNGPQQACSHSFTQTEAQHASYNYLYRESSCEQRRRYTKASYRFSYPQCSRDALVSNHASSNISDVSSRKSYKRSKLSKKARDGAYHAYQRPVKSAMMHDHIRSGGSDVSVDALARQAQSHGVRRRHRVLGPPNGATTAQDTHNSIPVVSKQCSSISPFPAESPPNPAPALFWAYREEEAEKSDHAKDSDSLPDSELKNWREMMERHGGSADSLTPLMDWSYLALTDHSPHAITAGFRLRRSDQRTDGGTGSTDGRNGVSSPKADWPSRLHKDWPKLSLSGLKSKLRIGGIHGIPENAEPCNSSCSENGEVFEQAESLHTAVAGEGAGSAAGLSCTPRDKMNGAVHIQRSTDCESRDACVGAPRQRRTTFPHVQQSVGGAALGWSACSKALPGWPNEDLSSIGASDSDMDDLSSPFLPQHFQYPRRSSAADSGPEKKAASAATVATATEVVHGPTLDSSISGDTIASGGFEVRGEVDTSPESDLTSCYAGQYEVVMETRLEQLSGNEAEGSDFSDADADVGSDVLEQSLTSLEEVASAVKYDREVNTWTSYTMTHIDSDDVVSDCTSDILNENVFDMATTNPGFDDVSLYFDDVGFPSLSLHSCKLDQVNTSLE